MPGSGCICQHSNWNGHKWAGVFAQFRMCPLRVLLWMTCMWTEEVTLVAFDLLFSQLDAISTIWMLCCSVVKCGEIPVYFHNSPSVLSMYTYMCFFRWKNLHCSFAFLLCNLCVNQAFVKSCCICQQQQQQTANRHRWAGVFSELPCGSLDP